MTAQMTSISFCRIDEGALEDYQFLHQLEPNYICGLPDRILAALAKLENNLLAYQVSRLKFSLQTAACAEQDSADSELILEALIHDAGHNLAPENHCKMVAAIIRLYVRDEVTWILKMHILFHMYYYADKLGLDKDGEASYRGHKFFNTTEKLCEKWDQMYFDPDCLTKELNYFEPIASEIFTRPPFDTVILQEQS